MNALLLDCEVRTLEVEIVKSDPFDSEIAIFESSYGLNFDDYDWVLEDEDALPWEEVYYTLKYRRAENQGVEIGFDYEFGTVQIRFFDVTQTRIVARSFSLYQAWFKHQVHFEKLNTFKHG